MAESIEEEERIVKKETLFYSGHKSIGFWKRINALPGEKQNAAYKLGVALQNFEADVLRLIKLFEEGR